MALLGQLVVKVTGDATQFDKTIDSSQKKFSGAGAKIRNVSLGIAAALIGIGAAALKASADMEQQLTAFTTLLGSGEKAKKLLEELEVLGAKTPLQLEDLTQNANVLLQYGINAESVTENLRTLGDVAQGNAAKLGSMTLAFAQISAAGRANMQDIRQMINAGFNPLTVIAEKTGESMDALSKRVSAGKVSFNEIEEAFKTATGESGRFFNAMDAQSQTFAGRLSTLQDSITIMARKLGDSLLPVAGKLITVMSDLVEEISKNESFFKSLGTAIGKIGEIIGRFAPILSKLLTALAPIIEVVFTLVAEIVDALMPAIEAIIDLITEILPILKPLLQLFGAFVKVVANLVSVFIKLIVPLIKPLLKLLDAFMPILEPLIKGFEQFSEVLQSDFVQGIIEAVSFLLKLLDPISQITTALEALGVIEKQNADSTDTASDSASEAAKSFDTYTESLDTNLEKHQEVNEERKKIEEEWKDNLFELKASETEKIEAEYQKQIEAARKAGASTKDIEEYYSLKRIELAKAEWDALFPEYAKNKEFVNGLLEDISKTDIQREGETFSDRIGILNSYIEERKRLIEEAKNDPGIILESGSFSSEEELAKQTALLENALKAREELEKQHTENVEAIYQKRASGYKKFIDLSLNLFGDMFSTLGEALVTGQNGWIAFAQSAVAAIATVVDALGNEAIAKAAVATANAIGAYASYNFPQGALYTSEAVAWGAAGVAAKLGAGIIKGLASQIKLADGGLVMPRTGGTVVTMAEAGVPEYAIPERADVLNRLAGLISSRIGNTTNITNNNLPGQMTLNIEGREFYATLSEASRDGKFQIDQRRGLSR